MRTQYHRDIGPLLQMFRSFLRGRSWNEQLRKPKDLSQRPYPKPELPGGSSDKTSANYYYSRDARRMVVPPITLMDSTRKQLSSGEQESTEPKTSGRKSAPKAGNTYNWDQL